MPIQNLSEPQIKVSTPILLVGMCARRVTHATPPASLWQLFMPHHHEIANRIGGHVVSAQVYGKGITASPDLAFDRWAAVEVSHFEDIPPGMEVLELEPSSYAVFEYTGPASGGMAVMQYIFSEWLPESGYTLDAAPHFEIIPPGYNPNDPLAKEEIWIPVQPDVHFDNHKAKLVAS